MKIALELLVSELKAAEEEKTFEPTPVSEYVVKHILEPMLRDEIVLFAELDFSKFSGEDINAMGESVARNGQMWAYLVKLNRVFCEAPPVSVPTRAFC